MSKTKTKQARRQLKRDGQRKIAEHQKKEAKKVAAVKPTNPRATIPSSKPTPKKQKPSTTPQKTDTPAPKPVQASQKHEVPFGVYEHILLVGEGDFSFTRSLVEDHGCANVTATSFDTEEEVQEKYPSFESTRAALTSLSPPVPLHHGIDAAKLSTHKHLRCARDEDDDEDGEGASGWDTIAFMFPHVGGLSTDVNRQVRSNQALLVSFFTSCLETSTRAQRLKILESQANRPNLVQRRTTEFLKTGGRIVVALFEGEPYTLWNIRDLARHAGLKVVESFKFEWSQYPSYSHVRTLGALEGGGWKGEDREARMYVFEKIALEADSEEEKELEKRGVKLGRKRKGRETAVPKKKRKVEDDDSD
jgi:25S rRNA (uracil2634-N3)-methyltransferase